MSEPGTSPPAPEEEPAGPEGAASDPRPGAPGEGGGSEAVEAKGTAEADVATEPMISVDMDPGDEHLAGPRMLGSASFFRLWMAQVLSALGDWMGLVAVLALAARVGGSSPEAAVGLVMSARLVPGFFLASVGGVLVDRWDRKRVMVTCDIGRGIVLGFLPFVNSVLWLVVASLLLEVMTLLWSPAKEASVPNLVSLDKLTSANSLSLVAAYGTFPIGSALFASLTKVAEFLGKNATALHFLDLNQESLAIYADMLTFFASAALISGLVLRRHTPARSSERIDLGRTFTEIKEGWQFIGHSPVVRAVMIGLGTGLIGGGMVAPLGPTFSKDVLHAGPAGFGLLLTALGMGVAAGVIGLSTLQKRLPHLQVFPLAVLGAGAAMMAAASTSSLGPTMVCIAAMGICAGAVYVLGFTILQESVDDDLRGRTFAAFYTLSRLCLLLSLAVAPLLSAGLDKLSSRLVGGAVHVGGLTVSLPGVRLTLWLGAAITLAAGTLALRTLRAGSSGRPTNAGGRRTIADGTEPA